MSGATIGTFADFDYAPQHPDTPTLLSFQHKYVLSNKDVHKILLPLCFLYHLSSLMLINYRRIYKDVVIHILENDV